MPYLLLTCRCTVYVVFVAAVAGKLRSRAAFDAFARSVHRLVTSRPRVSTALSGGTVLAETAVVVLTAIPRTVPVGLALAGLMLLVFCAGIVVSMRSGASVPCRCFGATSAPLGPRHLVRNAALLSVVAAGLVAWQLRATGRPATGGAVLAVAVAVVLALIVIFFDDLADLFGSSPAPPRT